MYLAEQQAWQLSAMGLDYSDIASYALNHDLSFSEAAAKLWEELMLTRLVHKYLH